MAIVIFDKVGFKPKLVRRGGKEQYTPVKGKIQQEDIATLNIYALNTMALAFIKEILQQLKYQW